MVDEADQGTETSCCVADGTHVRCNMRSLCPGPDRPTKKRARYFICRVSCSRRSRRVADRDTGSVRPTCEDRDMCAMAVSNPFQLQLASSLRV